MAREFFTLLRFVTRLPVNIDYEADPEGMSRSFRLLPVWGFLLGAGAAGLGLLFNLLSPYLAAAMALALVYLISGGAHMASAVFIAVGGGRKTLIQEGIPHEDEEIKPYFSSLSGALLLLVKFALYAQAFASYAAFPLLPAAMVFSAWSVAWAIYAFPSTGKGKGSMLHGYFRREDFISASLLSGLILMIFGEWQLIVGALLGLFGIIYLCRRWVRVYQGLNWRCYSALIELGEVFFLAAYFLVVAALSLINFLAL